MQNVLEQGPDFWCWFDKTLFSYHCVYPIHAKMFSIQMLLHFSQIVLRVCTLVLFIIIVVIVCGERYNNIHYTDVYVCDYFISSVFNGTDFLYIYFLIFFRPYVVP